MNLNQIITIVLFSFLLINYIPVYATTPDSTGVRTENGKKFIIHKVEPKEGWMAIARRYNVTMEQVKLANSGVESLIIGQLVNVPVLNPAKEKEEIRENKPQEVQVKPKEEIKFTEPEKAIEIPVKDKYKTPVKHTVGQGETLFSISKRFNVKMDDIRTWNAMEDNNLQLGQDLIIGYVLRYNSEKNPGAESVTMRDEDIYASAGEVKKTRKELRKEKREAKNQDDEVEEINTPEVNIAEIKIPETKKTDHLKTDNPETGITKTASTLGKKAVPMTEKGRAAWIDDNDINPSKFYALHRTAPPGTIIKVTNRMNNKTVFVKVVGVLPDTGDNSNLTIKLSKAAANKLDVIDARFQAELNYTLYE